MARTKIQAIDAEVPFRIEDLIFSTTDQKGFIRSINDVFLQTARYSREDVLGEPQNLVRHKDMPKCVFALYWDYIQSGKAIGAYVKNMASDGAFYWVYTLATPLKDGYLAIRFKTTSKYLAIVTDLYKEICEFEASLQRQGKANTECIAESTKLLNTKLAELGFESYDAFMITTLEEEMRCRDEQIQQEYSCNLWERGALNAFDIQSQDRDPMTQAVLHLERACSIAGTLFSQVGGLLSLQTKLDDNAVAVMDVSKLFEMSSINVSLEATRIGVQAQCLSVIANHLGESSQTVCELAESMQAQINTTSRSLGDVVFRLAAARLQAETMLDFSRKCRSSDLLQSEAEDTFLGKFPRQRVGSILADLLDAVNAQQGELKPSLDGLIDDLRRLDGDITNVKRSMLTLRFAQLGGTIESARLEEGNAITGLVKSIGDDIAGTVGQISELESDLATVAADIQLSFRQLSELQNSIADIDTVTNDINATKANESPKLKAA